MFVQRAALAWIKGSAISFLDSSMGQWQLCQKTARKSSKKIKQNLLSELTPLSVVGRNRHWLQCRRLERQSRSETMEYVWVSPLDHCFAKLILSFHVICQTQYWMYILCWQASSAKTGNLLLNGSLNGLRFMCQKSDLGYLLVFFKNIIFFMISMNILII